MDRLQKSLIARKLLMRYTIVTYQRPKNRYSQKELEYQKLKEGIESVNGPAKPRGLRPRL